MWSVCGISFLTVMASAVNAITVNPTYPLKNGVFTLTAAATGSSLTWVKDSTVLTGCTPPIDDCDFPTPIIMPNAIITVNGVTQVSTISVSNASEMLNGGLYGATGSVSKTVIVSTLPTFVQWKSHPVNGSSVDTGKWIAETSCVYPYDNITIDFKIFVEGVLDSVERVSTSSKSESCDSPERVVLAELDLYSNEYANERVYIVANASHDFFPNLAYIDGDQSNVVIFKGPTTQTSTEYVVGGITSTNFNVDLSSSSPINTEEVTSTTSYVIVSMESPYPTNTDNTVILAYHPTDSLSMQTLSIKSIPASQTIPATSVWNTSKSLRTDLYFQESSGLLVTSSLYESFSTQSLNQTNFVSAETQSDNVLIDSITTLSNILFTNTDSVPISLQATYSSKYSIKSAGDNSPLTVYPSSGLLRTDLFVQSSEVNLLVSKFEITNSVRLSTFSTYLESDFIDAIATTLITTNSYFLTDFSFSKTLVEDSFMQHNTHRQSVTTSNPFIASMSSSDGITEKESEDIESDFLNYSSILSTYSSDQYVSDTFERSINTNKGSSYLHESTLTESFHSMTNLRDDVISTGDMATSLKTTTSMSDYLVIDLQSNTQILSTERYGYFVTTIQADVKSSPLEIEVYHSNTSSNFRYSILHTSTTRTFKNTPQSVVSSQINSNSVMQSYRQYESPGIELTSSYFKTSSQSTEKLQSSDTSYHISSKTPIDTFSKITKNDVHLSTMNLSFSAIETGIPAEKSVASSITKKEFVTQTTGTLSQSEYIEPGASSFTYASTESLFHDSVILYSSASVFFNLTSDIFTPSVTPVSYMSSTSVYLTSTASQNVISEQTKDIIVISTASSIICFSILILLISLFAKKYCQKDKQPIDTVTDQIRWTNYIQSNKDTNKKMFSDSLDTGNSLIFPRLNTKLYSYPHHYEHNWEDIGF